MSEVAEAFLELCREVTAARSRKSKAASLLDRVLGVGAGKGGSLRAYSRQNKTNLRRGNYGI